MAATTNNTERWVTKRELAFHLSISTRMVEKLQPQGLPFLSVGAANRYQVSAVTAWLACR